jgi:hypothetical protein
MYSAFRGMDAAGAGQAGYFGLPVCAGQSQEAPLYTLPQGIFKSAQGSLRGAGVVNHR